MDHYIDIKLLPDPEFQPAVIMNALYSKLHRVLVELKPYAVAVSFPDYKNTGKKSRSLGESLRLHGNKENLEALMAQSWLRGVTDLISVSDIQAAPATNSYWQVRRVRCKNSVDALARRYQKRHGVSAEAAAKHYEGYVEQPLELPFLNIKSASTAQQFRLFIKQTKTDIEQLDAVFNCYGLSANGTVPAF